MVDYNDILNALDNLNSYRKRATMEINKPGIMSSIPNYKTEQALSNIGKAGKAAGLATTAVPFYKDFAFPVANDLYQGFIKGDVENSKVLQAALRLAGLDKYGNKVARETNNKQQLKQNNTGVPSENIQGGLEEINPYNMGYDISDIPLPKTNSIVAKQQDLPNVQQQLLEGKITSDGNEEIESILKMAKDRNSLYINALNDYLKNYPKNLENAKRSDLYFYGAKLGYGLDPRAGQKFNAIQNEADMVNTIKAMQDAKNAGVDYANEVTGNSAIAQDIGLPQEAAFANKNLLSAYSMRERDKVRQAIANANYLTRMYGIDSRAALQLTLQQMRNENALAVAGMYSGMGYPGVGLTSAGQPQSTSVAPVQYPQQQQVQSVDPRQQFFN